MEGSQYSEKNIQDIQPEQLQHTQELVLGLVGALGTDLKEITRSIQEFLNAISYTSEIVRVSELMQNIPAEPWNTPTKASEYDRIEELMERGNKLREKFKRNDALALLATTYIQHLRSNKTGSVFIPQKKHVYIVYSMKRPEEVDTFRRIYGSGFALLAAYAPIANRVENLSNKIGADGRGKRESHIEKAKHLLKRDESEVKEPFGQNVRGTFWQADVFLDASRKDALAGGLRRILELVFGNEFHTPTREEYGMFIAQASAFRSASLARQVGAAISTSDGSIVSTGTNEVPKSGGGVYWASDSIDCRDHTLGYDPSDALRRNLISDTIARLKKHNWLSEDRSEMEEEELLNELLSGPIMKGAEFMSLIEYQRAVHAEMTAITDAARRSLSVQDCTLYTTTFPCHGCARHIVSSGIKKVVYIEPYPKSLISDLHSDAIALEDNGTDCSDRVRFQSFIGVAPRMYMQLFRMNGERKRKDGKAKLWDANNANVKLELLPHLITAVQENLAEKDLSELILTKFNTDYIKETP